MKLRPLTPPLAFLCNLALAYLLYFLCRVVYILEFWDIYSAGWGQLSVASLLRGGFVFDTSAILYTYCSPGLASGTPREAGISPPRASM